jgi:transposase InsO family protein
LVESWLFGYLRPSRVSPVLGVASDLARSRAELIAENALLRHQLGILQRQVKRPQLTKGDRVGLLFWASRLRNWKQALLIVQPETLLRWHREGFRLFWKLRSRAGAARPGLPQATIDLIQRMASENPLWGAERIRGELLKVGIKVAKRSIQKYLRGMRTRPAPSQNWAVFLKNHSADIFVCDFLQVVDVFFQQLYLFFIIELETRRVVHVGVTREPTQTGVVQQWREATPYGEAPRFVIRDNDGKYGHEFDEAAEASGTEVIHTPYRAPRANAVCERFLRSARQECLDHVLIISERQLLRIAKAYVAYFNEARPHQGLRQRIPCGTAANVLTASSSSKVIAFPVMNGLHHDYRLAA